MSTIIKRTTTKGHRLNPHNGLNKQECFQLEKDCLTLLNSNFECKCHVKCEHFPRIVSCNPDKCKFLLSNCGFSLDKLPKLLIPRASNIEQQIDCIIFNLQKCKIKHLDMVRNGQNVCVNENGIISIIDFDIAAIDNDYKTKKIKLRANEESYGKYYGITLNNEDDYYAKLKKILTHLIQKKTTNIM